jgi:hypothetical protein
LPGTFDLKKMALKSLVKKDVLYGNGADQVGAMGRVFPHQLAELAEEIPSSGPESFSCDAAGNLLVADTVRNRIQVYSPSGAYVRSIALGNSVLCNDIATDDHGNIFVFDDVAYRLVSYSTVGTEQSSLSIPHRLWGSRGPLHLVNDTIYAAADDQRDVPLAVVKDGILVPIETDQTNKVPFVTGKGLYGSDGKRYSIDLMRYLQIHIEVVDAQTIVCIVDLPLEGVVSASFLGVTRNGNFFIQTERTEGEGVKLAAHQFSSDGKLLATSDFPENDYGIWSIKLLCIDAKGTLWQVIPSSMHMKIRGYVQETQ